MHVLDALAKQIEFQPYIKGMELRAGDVLRLKDGDLALVGDVNPMLGVCDDCREFKEVDIEAVGYLIDLVVCREHREPKIGAVCPNAHA